jgi:hypothetical protein
MFEYLVFGLQGKELASNTVVPVKAIGREPYKTVFVTDKIINLVILRTGRYINAFKIKILFLGKTIFSIYNQYEKNKTYVAKFTRQPKKVYNK